MSDINGSNYLFEAEQSLLKYVSDTKFCDIFECLVTGLVANLPPEPWDYLGDRLSELKTRKGAYSWNMFVPEDATLQKRIFPKGLIRLIEKEEQALEPSADMYMTAYTHYKTKLLTDSMLGFRQWRVRQIEKRRVEQIRFHMARSVFNKKLCARVFSKWLEWSRYVTRQHAKGAVILYSIDQNRLLSAVIRAWRVDARQSRKQSLWMKRLMTQTTSDPDYPADDETADNVVDEIGKLVVNVVVFDTRLEGHMVDGKQLVAKIFSHLDFKSLARCARVSRAWKLLTQESSLWRHINLSQFRSQVTDKALSSVLSKCRPFLGHLSIRGCYSITKVGLKNVSSCRNLQDLNLSEIPSINDEALASLCQNCPSLLYLNISYTDCGDNLLRALSRHCINLRFLSLAHCLEFTTQGMLHMAEGKGCHKLVHVDLSGCVQLTPDYLVYLGKATPQLQTIILSNIHSLSDDALIGLSATCHHLRHVNLIGCRSITDLGVKALAIQNRELKVFKLEDNQNVTDVALKTLAQACVQLSHIHVANCGRLGDLSLKALKHLKHLQIINVADCIKIGDAGIRQVVEGDSKTRIMELTLTNLVRISDVTLLRMNQHLVNLSYVSFCYCEFLTDAGVELVCSLSKLSGINLSGCNITDSGIASLGEYSILKYVSLSECVNLTDLGIEKFCSNAKHLSYLDLSYCRGINNTAVKNVAFFCGFLVSLDLSNCIQLTDNSMDYVSQGCRYVRTLKLSGCKHLSDNAIKSIRSGLLSLKEIDISNCPKVSQNAIHSLEKRVSKVIYSQDAIF
ncbi:F-box/LRR-repeat protein 13-like [Oopsacas minuta]|uniref:F-box/LRR-repeat protein 13-like n=1 Tax=Oopsacas minuta TaxID=111878 RepID=A0AAV7K6F6_9METZ|nr:F-box/LRR-repeat protein 13-like [Oopsacas minuta]